MGLIGFIILLVLLWYLYEHYFSDHMTAKRVMEVTGGKMDISYEEMAEKLPEATIYNYYDLKSLYNKGIFNEESIQKALTL